MRSNKQVAIEALRRASENRERKRRRNEWLSTAGLSTALLLFVGVMPALVMPGGVEPAVQQAQASVTLMDGATTGGYVLAGLIGFLAGAIMVMIVVRRRKP